MSSPLPNRSERDKQCEFYQHHRRIERYREWHGIVFGSRRRRCVSLGNAYGRRPDLHRQPNRHKHVRPGSRER